MMLFRSMIRSNALPAFVTGHLPRKLNTNTDPAAYSGNGREHEDRNNHQKSPNTENVSLSFAKAFINIYY